MKDSFKNIAAVVVGIVVGGAVNMSIIMVSGSVIAPPAGVDVSSMESLSTNMHLFEPKHFIMPFLAHALGTLVGAFLAAKIAARNKLNFALAVSIFFFLGGIANAFMLPAPTWFLVVDLLFAYIPMGWLGAMVAGVKK